MTFKKYFLFHENFNKKEMTLEQFRAAVLGAFQLVFDVGPDEVYDKNIVSKNKSDQMGPELGFFWDSGIPLNAKSQIDSRFVLEYKNREFPIRINFVEWKTMPSFKDYSDRYTGRILKYSSRDTLDLSGHITAAGIVYEKVTTLDKNYQPTWDIDQIGILHEIEIEGDPEKPPFKFKKAKDFEIKNLIHLAEEIKRIIDDSDDEKTNYQPERPAPQTTKPIKPELVGV